VRISFPKVVIGSKSILTNFAPSLSIPPNRGILLDPAGAMGIPQFGGRERKEGGLGLHEKTVLRIIRTGASGGGASKMTFDRKMPCGTDYI
jgi:hypothetical protein